MILNNDRQAGALTSGVTLLGFVPWVTTTIRIMIAAKRIGCRPAGKQAFDQEKEADWWLKSITLA
jgi:hypothetical protein